MPTKSGMTKSTPAGVATVVGAGCGVTTIGTGAWVTTTLGWVTTGAGVADVVGAVDAAVDASSLLLSSALPMTARAAMTTTTTNHDRWYSGFFSGRGSEGGPNCGDDIGAVGCCPFPKPGNGVPSEGWPSGG